MKNIIKLKINIGLFIMAIILSGCCNIVSGDEQNLRIETDQGSKCVLSNNKGVWNINNAPGSVTIQRDAGNLTVKCVNGPKNGIKTIKSSVKKMIYGNILVAGMLSTIVDYETGAAYQYPEIIMIPLK